MSDSRPYAMAHGEPLMVPAPDGVETAISAVMARHRDELDVALRPYGLALDDLLQPTWLRFVRVGDVEAFIPVAGINAAPDAGEDLHLT